MHNLLLNTQTHTHTHACMHTHMNTNGHTHIHTYTHNTCMHTHTTHARACAHTHTHAHACTHGYKRTHTHTCTHIHTQPAVTHRRTILPNFWVRMQHHTLHTRHAAKQERQVGSLQGSARITRLRAFFSILFAYFDYCMLCWKVVPKVGVAFQWILAYAS